MRLPTLLRSAGAHVSALVPAGATLRWSRHVDRWLAATGSDGAGFVSDLRAATEADDYHWIALTDDLTIARVVIAAQEAGPAAQDWFDRVLPVSRDRRRFITSKSAMAEAGSTGAIQVPRSIICLNFDEVWAAAAAVGFPLVLKADRSFAGNGVRTAINREELVAAFSVLAHRVPVVVQPFLSGRVGSTSVIFDHGRVLGCLASYKAVCFPAPFGPSCVREMRDVDEPLWDMAVAVGRVSGFHGIAGIDWIESPAARPLALEFNPRVVPSLHLGRLMGMDVPAAVRAMLNGTPGPAPDLVRSSSAGRRVYLFPHHAKRCILYGEYASLWNWLIPGRVDWPWREPWMLARQAAGIFGLAGWRVSSGLRGLRRGLAGRRDRWLRGGLRRSPVSAVAGVPFGSSPRLD